jgi:hypothetical protein
MLAPSTSMNETRPRLIIRLKRPVRCGIESPKIADHLGKMDEDTDKLPINILGQKSVDDFETLNYDSL